jgi:hypothetical protein
MIYTVHLRLLHDPMHNQSSPTGAPFSSSNNAFPTQVINWMPLKVNLLWARFEGKKRANSKISISEEIVQT